MFVLQQASATTADPVPRHCWELVYKSQLAGHC